MFYFNLLLSIFPIWGSLFLFAPKDFKEIHTKVFTQERTDYAIVEGHIFNLNSKYGKDFEDGEELIFTQLDTDKKYCGVFITAITQYKLKEK